MKHRLAALAAVGSVGGLAWLLVGVPAARPALELVLVVIAVVLLAVVLAVGAVGLILYRRAERDVRASPRLERLAQRSRSSLVGGVQLPDILEDETDAEPWRTMLDLIERLRLATTTPHFELAQRQEAIVDMSAHLVRIWVRGPDRVAVQYVYDDLGHVILRMADALAPIRPPWEVGRLRQIGTPGFRPSSRDWRILARSLEAPPALFRIARFLVANRRWRDAAVAYYRFYVMEPKSTWGVSGWQ